RTLRAVVDWSWDLLAEAERLVLRRLSVFAGGATLEAAEAVAPEVPELLDVIARLLDKSLLTAEKGTDTRLRYRMLETVRVYAAERLMEAGEASKVGRAHAEFFMRLAEVAEPDCRSKRQLEVGELLDAEHDNVNAALSWTVHAYEGEIASRLAGAMAWFWWLRGGRVHAAAQLDAALRVTDASPTRHRARALLFRAVLDMSEMKDWSEWRPLLDEAHRIHVQLEDTLGAAFADLWRSWALIIAGDRDGGTRVLDAALAVFDDAGDDWSYASGLLGRASHALYSGDIAAAARDGAECLDRFRVVGDRWMTASALQVLATVAEVRGDYPSAVSLAEEALALTRRVGATDTVPFFLAQLGTLFALQDDFDRADRYHAEALAAALAVGYRGNVAFAYFGMAVASRRRGALDQARAHLEEALALSDAEGLNVMAAPTFAHLGFVLELQGDLQRAEAMHREGLRLAGQLGDPRACALAAEGLAGVAAAVGNPERAALLLGWALAARDSAGAPLPPAERLDVDRIEAAARRALGDS
ncbi:MAG: ATP-binding protein, partial [Egibacteraceae bacterium]